MTGDNGMALTVSATMHLGFAAVKIWPLLCPVREYDWIEDWTCEVLKSESGFNESGCVFSTNFPGEYGKDIWFTSRYDKDERLEFVRTNEARVIHYIITLDERNGSTRMTWTQHVTALNKAGRRYLEGKQKTFASQMTTLEKELAHYLETGTMLKG